ncbi:type VI secretion system lipoprotein TssJ [Bordetella genomosp. 11]|nr:type VI secretion system lipoprotein TssJ [Bordetella genomosp. 11]
MCDRRRLAVRLLIAGCLLACLAACASAPAEQRRVCLRLVASPTLNPDRDGRASPVVVRIYELTQADDFLQAGFFDLYGNDKQLLGDAMLSRSVVSVRPGQQLDISHAFVPGTRYIAVLVAYRDIYRSRWRSVVRLPQADDDEADSDWMLKLNADRFTVTPLDGKNDKGSWKEGSHVLEQ